MESTELKSIWDAYDKKLEKSLKLNIKILENLQTDKAKSKLNALLAVKLTGIILGMLWILFLGALVYGNHFKNIYFSISLTAIMLSAVLAIVTYVRHVILINGIDYNEGIILAQQKLASLQLSTIQITRILWLQTPFYTTFFWNQTWIDNSPQTFWTIAAPITIAFAIATGWLYKNITPQNLNKKWLGKLLMMGVEYKYVLSASQLLKEIEAFKLNE